MLEYSTCSQNYRRMIMSLGFDFDRRVNPQNSLDSNDLPPIGWDTDIDTNDYRAALYGFPSDLFVRCCEWEKRELVRLE